MNLSPSNVFKVVVAVDVQNCFLYATKEQNASFLNLDTSTDTSSTIETSKQVTREISELVKDIQPDACVFTRDLHPMNHLSFMDDEGRQAVQGVTWPRHCRNPTTKCAQRNGTTNPYDETTGKPAPPESLTNIKTDMNTKLNMIESIRTNDAYKDYSTSVSVVSPNEPNDRQKTLVQLANNASELYETLYKDKDQKDNVSVSILNSTPLLDLLAKLKISGNEISYLFYLTPLLFPCLMLNLGNKTGKYKIGSAHSTSEVGEVKQLKDGDYGEIVQPSKSFEFDVYNSGKKTKFVALTKGERCDQESYSAFNYHLNYKLKDDKTLVENVDPPAFDVENSTGLWEWILANKGAATEIEIYVCGLVGNVCVIQSVLQGMAMWDNVYTKTNTDVTNVKFKYSLLGTRFTNALPPNAMDPYGIATKNIMDTNVISTDMKDWISQINSLGLLNNIVKNELNQEKAYNFDVYLKKPNENAQNITISGVLTMPTPQPVPAPAGGKRRTRKTKYCKICKGCCKKKHAKNRRNLCKTRRR